MPKIIFSITVDENGASRLNEYPDNQKRREMVFEEFQQGHFTAREHADFLIKEMLAGHMVMPRDAAGGARLEALLNGNGEIAKHQQEIADTVLHSALKRQRVVGMTATGMVPQTEEYVDTFNMKSAVADFYQKTEKDDAYTLINKARKIAIERKINGGADNVKQASEVAAELRQEYTSTKGLRLLRRRRLDKVLREVDPSYWSTKVVNGNGMLHPYYKMRQNMVDYPRRNFSQLSEKLMTRLEQRETYDGYKWLSKNGFKKLQLGAKLMFAKSPEKLAQKLGRYATVEQLNTLNSKLQKLSSDKDKEVHGDTGLESARLKQIERIQGLNGILTSHSDNLAAKRESMLAALPDFNTQTADEAFAKVAQSLQSNIADLREQYNAACERDPAIRLYKQLHGGNLPANGKQNKEVITSETVLQQMAKDLGYEDIDKMLGGMGVKEGEIAVVKKTLGIEKQQAEEQRQLDERQHKQELESRQKEQREQEEQKSDEAQKQEAEDKREAAEEKKRQEDEEKKEAKAREDEEARLEEERKKEEEEERKKEKKKEFDHSDRAPEGMVERADMGNGAKLYSDPEHRNYSTVAVDENGNKREPTDDELKKSIDMMYNDGVRKIGVRGFSPESQEKILKMMEEKGIEVTNREEIEQNIAQAKENAKKQENQTASMTGEGRSEIKTEARQSTEQSKTAETSTEQSGSRPAKPEAKEEKMTMEKLASNVVKTNDETMPEKLRMIADLQEGKEIKKEKIDKLFGKESNEAKFLGEYQAANALNQQLGDHVKAGQTHREALGEDALALHDLENEAGVKSADKGKVEVSNIVSLAEQYKDKTPDELKNDAEYQSLPKYAKGGVDAMIKVENTKDKDGKPVSDEQKQKAKERIIGSVIERQSHEGKRKPVKPRTLSNEVVAGKVKDSKSND